MKSIQTPNRINPADGVSETEMTMDPEVYDDYIERINKGEFIEFNLPDDTNVPRLSERQSKKEENYETVNPDEIFGGDK